MPSTKFAPPAWLSRLGRRGQVKRRVVGACPETSAKVTTYATMTPAELARFDRTLALYCPVCRKAHQFGREDLSLSDAATSD